MPRRQLELAQLKEMKAQPVSKLQGGVSTEGAAATPPAHKPCDAACEKAKEAGKAKMKSLQDMIDKDFSNTINYGNDMAYVPPVESVEDQMKDGSMWNSMKTPKKPPPKFIASASIVPDAATVHLDTRHVQDEEKDVPQVDEKSLVKSLDSAIGGADDAVKEAFSKPDDDDEGAAATSSKADAKGNALDLDFPKIGGGETQAAAPAPAPAPPAAPAHETWDKPASADDVLREATQKIKDAAETKEASLPSTNANSLPETCRTCWPEATSQKRTCRNRRAA